MKTNAEFFVVGKSHEDRFYFIAYQPVLKTINAFIGHCSFQDAIAIIEFGGKDCGLRMALICHRNVKRMAVTCMFRWCASVTLACTTAA